MSRRRLRKAVHHDRWLISYADFITLLFAFFVVLFAASQSDKHKQAAMAGAIARAFGQNGTAARQSGPAGPAPALTMQASMPASSLSAAMLQAEALLRAAAQPELGDGVVEIRQTDGGLTISLKDAGFFDSGSAAIKPQALPVLDRIATALPSMKLRVEGHSDNVPIATAQFASNWELSSARASSIARLLLRYPNVHPDQLSVAGYAEFHPIADNATPSGRARNRRVDLVIEP
jgi:chemotaxis protein MotB